MSEWVPVSERLPDHGGTVVCRTQDRQLKFGRVMTVSTYSGGEVTETKHWRGYPDCPLEVTHWFPLPPSPSDPTAGRRDAMADTEWHFDWPSGYVRYKDGKREVWQDSHESTGGLRLAPDERDAISAMACYFDTKGNIQMQAWGSLLRVILLRNDRLGHQE